jgi:ribosomal protein S1
MDNGNPSDFASLFEKSLAAMDKMKPGQPVTTTIVSIGNDTVFLELGGKSEGVLDRAEVTDKDGALTVSEGDQITVYFLGAKNGESRFTTGSPARRRTTTSSRAPSRTACRSKAPSRRKSRAATRSRSAAHAPSAPSRRWREAPGGR